MDCKEALKTAIKACPEMAVYHCECGDSEKFEQAAKNSQLGRSATGG
jgi:hypothetical protein